MGEREKWEGEPNDRVGQPNGRRDGTGRQMGGRGKWEGETNGRVKHMRGRDKWERVRQMGGRDMEGGGKRGR